ncbi:MAG: hypothetical protein IPM57_08300 [Oligoflexia bacterium]|nr:hypothetical protein [Oligoflexia bacterium]
MNCSKDKNKLREDIDKFINSKPELLKPLSESLWTIADELFMNSFYDAPTDSNGKHLYAQLPRTSAVQLEKAKPVEIFICFDDANVIIGSIDFFGSFNENKFLKQFNSSYTNENSNINMGKGGAGIGCKIMFEHSMSTYFYSLKNKFTLVCCKIPTYHNKQRKDLLYKNLHLSIK